MSMLKKYKKMSKRYFSSADGLKKKVKQQFKTFQPGTLVTFKKGYVLDVTSEMKGFTLYKNCKDSLSKYDYREYSDFTYNNDNPNNKR